MATFVSGRVAVSVPATSANLGPGYDSLGLALDLRDRVTAEVVGSGAEITVHGSGEGEVALDEAHLVYRAMSQAFEAMGAQTPGIRLHCENQIPHGRGLGSSSAAIVAGISAARALLAGGSLLMDDDAVFDLAATIEGHPDNVAPCFYGGFTVSYRERDQYRSAQITVDPRVSVVVFVPPDPVQTTVARGLLPGSVPHADAAANSGRTALLVAALSRAPELLFDATRDYLHQEHREPAMPQTLMLVRDLRADGVPATVSGAGPSVLAFTDRASQTDLQKRVPDRWEAHPLAIDHRGVQVNTDDE